jgi:hypothetical protein
MIIVHVNYEILEKSLDVSRNYVGFRKESVYYWHKECLIECPYSFMRYLGSAGRIEMNT